MKMLSDLTRAGFGLLLVALPILGFPLLAQAEERMAGSFGDWSKICSPVEQGEVCQISQTVNQNESGQRLFQTSIGYVSESENPIMFLTAPLGMYLPRGITLELTEDTLTTAVVQRCDVNGCLAVTPLEPAFLDAMKTAKEGRLIFGRTAEQNMAVPLSLMGFTAGMASLQRYTPPVVEPTPAAP
jgi:invasion protein IalB